MSQQSSFHKGLVLVHSALEGAVGLSLLTSPLTGTTGFVEPIFPADPNSNYPVFLGSAILALSVAPALRMALGDKPSIAEPLGMAIYHVSATGFILKSLLDDGFSSDPVPFLFHLGMSCGLACLMGGWKCESNKDKLL